MSHGAVMPGTLRHRLLIQRNGTTQRDAYGEMQPAEWVDVARVWASVTPKRANETTEADRVEARITHEIRMQYRDDVSEAMRVVWGNRVLQISQVINIGGQNRGLLIMATETAGEVAA